MKHQFPQEKLFVYQLAMRLLVIARDLESALEDVEPTLLERLCRASTAIPLEIAKGASVLNPWDGTPYYKRALRSAAQCCAIFDICRRLDVVSASLVEEGAEILEHMVPVLTGISENPILNRDPGADAPKPRATKESA